MNTEYLNIYNNLIKLTRNKLLYTNLIEEETFSDRIIFLLLHLSFFFKSYKQTNPSSYLQEIHMLYNNLYINKTNIPKNCIVKIHKRYFRPLEVKNLKGNYSKAKKFLRWKPKRNLNQLIDEMIDYELK